MSVIGMGVKRSLFPGKCVHLVAASAPGDGRVLEGLVGRARIDGWVVLTAASGRRPVVTQSAASIV